MTTTGAPDTASDDREPTLHETEFVVRKICELSRDSHLEFARNVGRLIIHYFYGGDTTRWRYRGPKAASFRRLAQHPGLPMSASSLYRCVAVYELCERLGAVDRWRHIGTSHLRLVLDLDEAEQVRLLSQANAQRWSVRRLQGEVQAVRSPLHSAPRRGIPDELRRLVGSAQRAARSASRLIAELAELEQRLAGALPGAGDAVARVVADLEQARRLIRQAETSVQRSAAQAWLAQQFRDPFSDSANGCLSRS